VGQRSPKLRQVGRAKQLRARPRGPKVNPLALVTPNQIAPSRSVTRLAWTPDDYSAAVRLADSGSLMKLADLAGEILHDGTVRGAYEQATAMLGIPPRFECPPALAAMLAIDLPLFFPEAEQDALFTWGLHLGIGFARKVNSWDPVTSSYRERIETWHPRWFTERRELDANGNTACVWYVQTDKGEQRVEPGRGWVIFAPYGMREPWRRGLARSLAVPYLAKWQAVQDRGRTSEVTPMIVGMTQGLSEPQRARFLADLSVSRDTRIVLPKGCDVKAVDVSGGSSRGTIQKDTIEWAKDEIQTVVLGNTVTTEGSSGFSNGDVQLGAQEAITRKRETAWSTCLGVQVITPHARMGYDWRGPTIWPRWIGATNDAADAPAEVADGVKIDLTPSDIATVVKVDQFLATLKLPPIGGEDGGLTVAQYQAKNAATIGAAAAALDGAAPPAAAPPPAAKPTGPDVVTPPIAASEVSDDADEDESVVALAARMTELRIARCEHDRRNRCTICGVERVRSVDRGAPTEEHPEGEPVWGVQWRPIRGATFSRAASAPARGKRRLTRTELIGDDPPTRFLLFTWGENESSKGSVWLTPEGAKAAIEELGSRELMIDLEHLSLDPSSPNYDGDARGWARRVELDDVGMWAADVRWTEDGEARIRSKRQRYTSPAFDTDAQGVVISLCNVALTALPATRFITPLVAASATATATRKRGNMDEKQAIGFLLMLLGLAPDAPLEDLVEKVREKVTGEPAAAPEMSPEAAMSDGEVPEDDAAAMTALRTRLGAKTNGEALAAVSGMAQAAKSATIALSRIESLEKRNEEAERASILVTHRAKFTPEALTWAKTATIGELRQFAKYAAPAVDTVTLAPPTREEPELNERERKMLSGRSPEEIKAYLGRKAALRKVS
jgi:hypothetical protein